jgi:hypothetical protein
MCRAMFRLAGRFRSSSRERVKSLKGMVRLRDRVRNLDGDAASGKAVYRDVVCAKALALSAVGGNNSEPLFEVSRDRYAHAKRSIPPLCHGLGVSPK